MWQLDKKLAQSSDNNNVAKRRFNDNVHATNYMNSVMPVCYLYNLIWFF